MVQALAFAAALVFPALVIWGAVKDATSYTIPNWISLALLAAFPVAALAGGLPLMAAGQHFGVGAAVLLIGMVMFMLRWVGGGDAKLMAASALWLGWPAVMNFMLETALAGAAVSLVVLLMRSTPVRPLALLGPAWVVRLAEPRGDIPYGLAIAAGALWAFPESPLGRGLLF
jgi:prepilin peptidase CpaA